MPNSYSKCVGRRVWPNRSLNRTLCGGPGLGFKSLAQTRPAAKCRLASTLGLTVDGRRRLKRSNSRKAGKVLLSVC